MAITPPPAAPAPPDGCAPPLLWRAGEEQGGPPPPPPPGPPRCIHAVQKLLLLRRRLAWRALDFDCEKAGARFFRPETHEVTHAFRPDPDHPSLRFPGALRRVRP